MSKLILASASPRRMEILKSLGLTFEVVPSNYDEIIVQKSPYELVVEFASEKAMEVAGRTAPGKIILAADTIVYKDGEILGKPKNDVDAVRMLEKLSNDSHRVISGLCLYDTTTRVAKCDWEETIVYFKELSKEEIDDYIHTSEPLDKAGAYGIQGFGGVFVKRIEGCYFNVVGLPVYKLNLLLGSMGVNLFRKGV